MNLTGHFYHRAYHRVAAMVAGRFSVSRQFGWGHVSRAAGRVEEEPLRSEVRSMIRRTGSEAYLRQRKTNATRPDRRVALGAISCPALAVCGHQDVRLPLPHGEEIAAGTPNAALVVIEVPTTERPQAASALMRDGLPA